jgi:hypothetical protein
MHLRPRLRDCLCVFALLAAASIDCIAHATPVVPPELLDPAYVARLTETIESEHFIFHFEPGDTVDVERSEAFHNWATEYLGITLSGKIDFYKFRTAEDLAAAQGGTGRSRAFPAECALVTEYSWNNHECMHIYNAQLCDTPTTRLFEEGMAVAHEFDPYNDVWVSQWNRRQLDEPFIYEIEIRLWHQEGWLFPMEDLLTSAGFQAVSVESKLGAYVQSGMFVSYLIETYGLERMKEIFRSVAYEDPKTKIEREFEGVFGASVQDVEREWMASLESP